MKRHSRSQFRVYAHTAAATSLPRCISLRRTSGLNPNGKGLCMSRRSSSPDRGGVYVSVVSVIHDVYGYGMFRLIITPQVFSLP